MKRLIIIPDVHGRDFWQKAVGDNPDGEFVFLGDYLDPYGHEGIREGDAFRGLMRGVIEMSCFSTKIHFAG